MNTFCFIALLVFATLSAISANTEIFPKEFGGVEVQPHSIPFIVSLAFKSEEKYVPFCTGSLLNEHWILTASHCLELHPDIDVIAGHHSMDTLENSTQVRKAYTVYQHESMVGEDSDCLGLIYVENGFTFNQEVQPVALGELSTNVNDKLSVQGWGASFSWKARIYPQNLRSANLSVTSADQCRTAYPKEFDGEYNFCGREQDRVACVEEGGGPVLQNGVQIGIVPWRSAKCNTTDLVIFRKVSPYKSWIQERVFESSTLPRLQEVIEINGSKDDEPKASEVDLIRVNVNSE